MELLGILYDLTENKKSKMMATKPDISISKLAAKIGTQFHG